MGDRTSVTLRLLKSHERLAETFFKESITFEGGITVDEIFCEYTFEEINYGTLFCLDHLEEAGIPFDSSWDRGDSYGPGTEYGRYTKDGDHVRLIVEESETNPSLEVLLQHINDPIKLREVILGHKASITPLPWENQEQYGKIYLTKKLITPK